MEVHAHDVHKMPGTGWKHYFFEFFMLFLAVFSGFLTENCREQIVEKHREKQFINSLAEDLKADTLSLQNYIRLTDTTFGKIDSVLLFIKNNPKMKSINYDFIKINIESLPWFAFSLTDRTSSQLKNGGNMRLIEDIKLSNQISDYWHMGEITVNSQERFNDYRAKEREVFFKIFKIYDFYLIANHLEDKNINIEVRQENLAMLDELGNYLATCGAVMGSYRDNLIRQKEMAVTLLSEISH